MFCSKLYPFKVTLHLNGRHPYLDSNKYDFETQDVTVNVTAKNWAHAEKVALYLTDLPQSWSRRVLSISRGH
jgi:hypothetical protein